MKRHQNHVAVKINGVAAMADDALPVHGVIHENESDRVEIGMKLELPHFHGADAVRFQDRRALQCPVTQQSEH
jgi:hypothetical protein